MAVAVSEQNAELSLTDVGGIRQYGLENRFKLAWRTADYFEYLDGCGLLLSRLRELTPGMGELFGQLLDPALRRSKIVCGQSCHDYTRFPLQLAHSGSG
jgi:hypothetical protein